MKKRVIALLMCAAMATSLTACNGSDYKKATSLYEEGNYQEAIALFEKLGDYQDSSEMIKQCNYKQAGELLDEGQFDTALELFTQYYEQDQAEEALEGLCNCAMKKLEEGDTDKATEILKPIKTTEKGKAANQNLVLVLLDNAYQAGALYTAKVGLEQIPADWTYGDHSAQELKANLDKCGKFVDAAGNWESEDGAPLSMRWDSSSYWEEYEGDVMGSTKLQIVCVPNEDGTVKMSGTVEIPLLSDLGKSIKLVTGPFSYTGTEYPEKIEINMLDGEFKGVLKCNDSSFEFSYEYNTSSNGYKYKYTGKSIYKNHVSPV